MQHLLACHDDLPDGGANFTLDRQLPRFILRCCSDSRETKGGRGGATIYKSRSNIFSLLVTLD